MLYLEKGHFCLFLPNLAPVPQFSGALAFPVMLAHQDSCDQGYL